MSYNIVTLTEVKEAKNILANMTDVEIKELKMNMAEKQFERAAAFGGDGELSPAIIEETGEKVDNLIYEICYNQRIAKLFNEH